MCDFIGKKYEEVGSRQQQRNRVKISNSLKDHCQDLPNSGLELASIQLRTTGSQDTIQIDIVQPAKEGKKVSKELDDKIPQISNLMLQYGISYEFYHELSSIAKELPRTYKVELYHVAIFVNC